ncbi:hypothetical protein M569_03813, partial [Genlisea aurea]
AEESSEVPDWIRGSGKSTSFKTANDDFIPPSMPFWMKNHECAVDVKTVVYEIVESDIDKLSRILSNHYTSPDLVVKALNDCDVCVSDDLVEQVLRRFSFDWLPAYGFFKWTQSEKRYVHPPASYDRMVDNLGKARKFDIMWELVEEMSSSSQGYISLNTITIIIRRLAKAGKYEDAIEAFRKSELFGVDKDVNALNRLMDSLVKEGSVEHAEKVFLEFRDRIHPISDTYNVLIHGWCRTRQIGKALKTADEMREQGFRPSLITYASFIEAYARDRDFRNVDATLQEMKNDGFEPNVVIYTIMMKALAKAKEIDRAMEVYQRMKSDKCSPDASFYNAFITALSKSGRLRDSNAVFAEMAEQGIDPLVSTYNTVISIAAENSQEEEALGLLLKMERNGCKPDRDSYAPLLKMSCRLKRMKVLRFLLRHMFENDVGLDLGTYSSLIGGLSRKGKLKEACSLFEESVQKGFVPMNCTYNILVKQLEKKSKRNEKQHVEGIM